MLHNPYIVERERIEQEQREIDAFRHEFSVSCIVETSENIESTATFRIVRQFCLQNKVPFSTREYDANRFEEDCDNIIRLPAYHIYAYRGTSYIKTVYPNQNVIQKIQNEIDAWHLREAEKKRRKEVWNKRVSNLIAFFENLSLKKKPALKIPLPMKKKPKAAEVPIEFEEGK